MLVCQSIFHTVWKQFWCHPLHKFRDIQLLGCRCLCICSVYLARYATHSSRRLPPVSQAVPKLPAVNEGGIFVDDIAKGDSGCVAIQQLYEDMRTDWSAGRHQEKSAKNGLDRTLLQVDCLSSSSSSLFQTRFI